MPLDANYDNHIPEAVRRQSARADEIARQAGSVVPGDEPMLPGLEADPAPVDQNPAPVDPPVDPAPAPAPVEEGWEQRYRTLQGKYDAEMPGLRTQVQNLERLLANLSTAPAPVAQPASVVPDNTTTVVVPQADVAEYGQDLVDAVRRWAGVEMHALTAKVSQLEDKLATLQTGHQRVEQTARRHTLQEYLDADPDIGRVWRKYDEGAAPEALAFHEWLAQVDPYAGLPRQGLLTNAVDRGDFTRIARFFKAFIAEHTATTGASAPTLPPPQTPTLPAPVARPTLESFAEPGRQSPAPAGGAPAEKRVWSQSQIARFYRDVQRGAYTGREPERLATERDIIAAAAEGRVR